jgi:hypothetical protein
MQGTAAGAGVFDTAGTRNEQNELWRPGASKDSFQPVRTTVKPSLIGMSPVSGIVAMT